MELKQVTKLDEIIIEGQGDIFEYMALYGYHMDVFSELYMRSDFVKRYYDHGYSFLQGDDVIINLDFLLPEIEDRLTQYPGATKLIPSVPGNDRDSNLGIAVPTSETVFDQDIAYWIGQMYRRLNIMTSIPSERLIELFPFSNMCSLYAGFHTIDEDQAVEILTENITM